MRQRIHPNDYADRAIQGPTSAERISLRESQIITYDPRSIKVLILDACGLEPARGTVAADQWRMASNHIFNRELDRLRQAHCASAGQWITFTPIIESIDAVELDAPAT